MGADMDENIEKLRQIVGESRNMVFFGWAGVSTESGIPDFRSQDGLYAKNTPTRPNISCRTPFSVRIQGNFLNFTAIK